MWTHAENKWGGFGKFDVDRTASLGKPAWHISAIFSLALAETVVWWRRRRRLDRWRHFRSAWRHQRPPAGVQAASGNDARSSDWLSATHRRTRCHGLYSVILNAPVLIVIFELFFTDHYIYFAIYGPALWNRLPASLRSPELSLFTFRRNLKTYLMGGR